jgi:alpha-ketoglutarate-dependent taurine dioxygenase
MDSTRFDPMTHQRNDVPYDQHNGKPITQENKLANNNKKKKTQQSCKIEDCYFDPDCDSYHIQWSDGHTSEFASAWVEAELSKWQGKGNESRILWSNLTAEQVRDASSNLSITFEETVMEDDGMSRALLALYQYGIVLVTNTPTHDGGSGVAALTAALGGGSVKESNSTSLLHHYRTDPEFTTINLPHGTDGPLRTLYGTIWSTSSAGQADGASVADSAYGHEGLPLHTDMTYLTDPPGLQIFTMDQPAEQGGESVYGDGFAIAERLRKTNPKAFATLSQTVRRYRSIDDTTGWHLEAHGPVISVRNGQVVGIRHNDLDRLPDLPPVDWKDTEEAFYDQLSDAHRAWDELVASDEFRLVLPLEPGDTMVVANQVSASACLLDCTLRYLLGG